MNLMKGSDISKSAFVGLKTELLKKQEEVKRIKDQLGKNAEQVLKPKKSVVNKKSNKGVENRILNDINDEFEDDTDVHRKSREVLEAKARLYDKLNSENSLGTTSAKSQYLVDFDVKHELSLQKEESHSEKSPPPDQADVFDLSSSSDGSQSDWVEYEDALGRTRKCMRKDLSEMKAKDSKLASSLRPPTPPEPTPQLVSRDMQRELSRQKWEEQEAALIGKTNVHYQDVLFDEARAHGVGYFEFSTNEEERLRQQEALKHMRKETVEKQQEVEAAHARRQQQLKVRLAAARKRRQERLGLPFEESEPQELEITSEPEKQPPKDDLKITDMEENIKKIASVRPWDIGKQEIGSVLSQEEWVEQKRDERLEEFAPPQSLLNNVEAVESINKKSDNFLYSRKARCEDKSRYDDALGSSAKACVSNKKFYPSVQINNERSNLNSLLKSDSESYLDQMNESNSLQYNSSFIPEDVRLTSTELVDPKSLNQHPNSTRFHEKLRKQCEELKTPICNEAVNKETDGKNYLSVDAPTSFEQSTKHFQKIKRKRAEIAPPATMEYFGGNLNSTKERKTEKVDLAESVSAGLHYLRELTEKKDKTRVKGLLDII